jgi:hypothetical protein
LTKYCFFVHFYETTADFAMPVIATLNGIVIRMYFFDDRRHSAPHVHAEYAEFRAVFAVATGDVLSGHLPPRQTRLVRNWIESRSAAVMAAWKFAIVGRSLPPIDSLEP